MASLARRRVSLFVIFTAVAVFAGVLTWSLPGQRGDRAPLVTFELLDGGRQPLVEWRGQMVLVNFWATTCPPCVEELPDLQALYRVWHPQGLEIIGVAMPYDPPNYVQAFQQRHGMPYPIALDVSGVVTRAFRQLRAVPTSYLINPEGDIVLEHVGRIERARIERMLRRYLDSEPDDS